MSSSNQAYNRITQTSKSLRKASKITTRRKAAEELIKQLADSNLRNKLKKESARVAARSGSSFDDGSNNNNSSTTSSTNALRKVYRIILNDAYHAAKKTIESNVRLKLEDIILPLKILRAIDSESDAMLSSIKKDQNHGWMYVPEPFTFESFHRYHNTNSTLTYLSSKEIKNLLKYCLDGLHDEDQCSIAEQELLNLLQKLCSRSDYVSFFGNSNDTIMSIIEELHPRIVPETEKKSSSPTSIPKRYHNNQQSWLPLNAAKTFYNLIHHLIAVLGIDIQIFAQQCLSLIVDWIRDENSKALSRHSSTTSKTQLLQFMYGVALDILAAYPELCVGIFKDGKDKKLGKDLFGYAKRCWTMARGVDRDVLVGYFSAHL
jgi:hypothetical protein